MNLRLCIPRVRGRGAGLGNQLIPWARAFLAAQVIDARVISPAFGLNRRGYRKHFGTSRIDWILNRALELSLPVFEFDEQAYQDHGGADAVDAFRSFAQSHNLHKRSAYAVVTDGMWGGYGHVSAARDFVISTLYQSRYAARNLLTIQERLNPEKTVVAMHVRLGDFASADSGTSIRGRFNVSLPLDWYLKVGHSLRRQLSDRVQFLVISDGTENQLAPLTRHLPCVLTSDIPNSDCSDLLAMAQSDLLVCSISSFSAWAASLSGAPYIWYAPNLQIHPEGYYSIWGNEDAQVRAFSPTKRAIETWQQNLTLTPRGWPVAHDGEVPQAAVDETAARRKRHPEEADLVRYGVVPIGPARHRSPKVPITQDEPVA